MTRECTYIMWPENTKISDDFFLAVMPVQAGNNLIVTERSPERVQEIAKQTGQTGLVIQRGEMRI